MTKKILNRLLKKVIPSLLLCGVLLFNSFSTYAAAYNWTGDAYGAGNRSLTKVWLNTPPSHPSYTGYGLVTANTISYSGGWLLRAYYSIDDGVSWYTLGDLAFEPDSQSYIGLANFVQVGTSQLWYAAVEHHTKPNGAQAGRIYRIEVLASDTYGESWSYDSTVASAANTVYGFWAPYLFLRPGDNLLQCYYDDEYTLNNGQQRISKKDYTPANRTWGNLTTVAQQGTFSRDGMPTVIALSGSGSSTSILCVFEAPEAGGAHPTRICAVTSANGGGTFGNRGVVYQPTRSGYHALCPWVTKDYEGKPVVVFSTDEDRYPSPPGDNSNPSTLHADVKSVYWNGTAWTGTQEVASYSAYGNINLLWPAICQGKSSDRMVIQFQRLNTDYRIKHGYWQ